MSSGNLDRVLKLWISLWNLVLEDNRHYESVCALLQRLIFEKMAWPSFKNWPAICELGKTNRLAMFVVATVDLSKIKESPSVQRIIAAFPECFSDVEVRGPVPWSLILANDHAYVTREGQGKVGRYLQSHDAYSEFRIPDITYRLDTWCEDSYADEPIFPVSAEADKFPEVGEIVVVNGVSVIMVENNDTNGFVVVVPAECIDLTC